MAMLMVVLDEKNREWKGPPQMTGVFHAQLAIDSLEFTEAEIELHATTLVKMLLQCVRESDE